MIKTIRHLAYLLKGYKRPGQPVVHKIKYFRVRFINCKSVIGICATSLKLFPCLFPDTSFNHAVALV